MTISLSTLAPEGFAEEPASFFDVSFQKVHSAGCREPGFAVGVHLLRRIELLMGLFKPALVRQHQCALPLCPGVLGMDAQQVAQGLFGRDRSFLLEPHDLQLPQGVAVRKPSDRRSQVLEGG